METTENKVSMAMEIADYASELKDIFERLNVLTDDISRQFYETGRFKTERAQRWMEYDFTLIRVKSDIIGRYVNDGCESITKLSHLAKDIYNMICAEAQQEENTKNELAENFGKLE